MISFTSTPELTSLDLDEAFDAQRLCAYIAEPPNAQIGTVQDASRVQADAMLAKND